MVPISPLEFIDALEITKAFFMLVGLFFITSLFKFFFHDANDISGEQAVRMQIMAIGSTVNIDMSDDDSHDYEVEELEPEPTPPALAFTPCPKCGAPRQTVTCEYCGQTHH